MIRIESSETIDRPVEEVFAFVTDSTNDPRWHKDAVEATKTSAGPIGLGSTFTVIIKFMGRKQAHWKVTGWEPNRREVIEVTAKPFSPTLTYLFEPAGGGTRFTRRVEIAPTGFFKFMQPMVRSMAGKRNGQFVRHLKDVLES
jgi:uncharacterized protein YndB with AHSA1/START domain